MGFDIQRFPNNIDEEFICSICGGVLQDPLQIPTCEHTFCQACIEEWLSQTKICPIDRTPVEINQMKLVPRILKNLLNRLDIRCENEGCMTIVKLEVLTNHLADCEYTKNKVIQCENGCGMIISKDNFQAHNCIQALSSELQNVKNELENYKNDVDFYKTEISTLQEFIRVTRANDPTISCFLECVENNQVLCWSNSLQLARVTHWGGMISTPDIVLQNAIREALLESGCPIQITNELIENAHERHWPQGLSTLETRQINRRHYESYVCRRIIGEQAIVVLSCDNRHMNQSMISEPGIVMIFSHGVK
ncbi:unnamed protein product [Rotaria magnacalcarata]|uniref:E3 ubiquitin-protein ligase NRDP1 n=3 Tax=Rotaria magnacalcarata TaxID=392030 RepID=A0A816VVY3_9BILA|nr:unnamed protein product [Rotaria magnacalcarata]CAF1598977.1 unnamed protein product [Rotaria magnacalcarata]CAF2066105.1 unnamed protein product [Rotaria magnacalcarata]CAF2125765.1 unnamed protein product [Rotaria magnacalcarata]CAF2145030.1 unnamed protein product [Rotaria magnacalcarata]